jgi:hypothetical protein
MRQRLTPRTIMSGALAALLLCVLSWASVCDLSCQLPALAGHGCCPDKTSAIAVVKSSDSGCHDMAGMATPSGTGVHASQQAGTMPCDQNVSIAAVDRSDHSFDSASVVAVTRDAYVIALQQSESMLHRSASSPSTTGLRPLLVCLRV